MSQADHSFSLARPHPELGSMQKGGIAAAALGLLAMCLYWFGNPEIRPLPLLVLSFALLGAGAWLYTKGIYGGKPAGIKNNGVYFRSLTARGIAGWTLGIALTAFYVVLYFYPSMMGLGSDGEANTGIVALFDPLSRFINGKPASQWFVYGSLYTTAILLMGYKFLWKYRHNRYQRIRTLSVMFFQLAFAYLIPEIMNRLNSSYSANWFDFDLKNFWPLDYDFFHDWHLDNMFSAGTLGMFVFWFGIFGVFVLTPVLTYFCGKRWYCSWVCGCGGLAETAGDPFRHLSDKSLRAWRIERYLVHGVLLFAVVMTIMVLYTYQSGQSSVLGLNSYKVREWYGFYIGAIFSGVVGVGFYPLMGSRVWCRFGCPMAAYIGIIQRFFSRFRITSNGSQCISCGNCSTYCEMGIDVRWYAQRGQDIVRASCVGCGICAAVCPRGVLRLENGAGVSERTKNLRAVNIEKITHGHTQN